MSDNSFNQPPYDPQQPQQPPAAPAPAQPVQPPAPEHGFGAPAHHAPSFHAPAPHPGQQHAQRDVLPAQPPVADPQWGPRMHGY